MLQLMIFSLLAIAVAAVLQLWKPASAIGQFGDRTHSTVLKGMAISGILLCHAAAILAPVGVARLLTPVGGIGVSIFLILSGYGLSESFQATGHKHFWKKRFFGTYLPYLLICLLTLSTRLQLSPEALLLDLLAIRPMAEYYWYISYLSIWYILFYGITRFIPGKWQNWLFLGCAAVLFFLLPELQTEQSLSFAAGVFLSRYREKLVPKLSTWLGAALFLVGAALLAVKQIPAVRLFPAPLFTLLQLGIKLSVASALVILTWRGRNLLPTTAFARIGAYSYELYLIHAYTIGILTWNFPKPALSGLFLAATGALAVAFGLLKKKFLKSGS